MLASTHVDILTLTCSFTLNVCLILFFILCVCVCVGGGGGGGGFPKSTKIIAQNFRKLYSVSKVSFSFSQMP